MTLGHAILIGVGFLMYDDADARRSHLGSLFVAGALTSLLMVRDEGDGGK